MTRLRIRQRAVGARILRFMSLLSSLSVVVVVSLSSNAAVIPTKDGEGAVVHTLVLCRHGDSIWNGGDPGGVPETFTGWTDVPLSPKGIQEAKATASLVSQFEGGIDVCATSILQRAQLTAHYCLWGFGDKPNHLSPRQYLQDWRLNERHYGALQGYVKRDVQDGKYGHDPALVQQWRRSWYTVPPLLVDDDTDPRRIQEVKQFASYCGGPEQVPRGESLEQVANSRIRPFLQEKLCPILQDAAQTRRTTPTTTTAPLCSPGGTGLIVAHANSLRALMGVICNVQEDPVALAKLEGLRLQTGIPLVLRFRILTNNSDETKNLEKDKNYYHYQPCDLDGVPFDNHHQDGSLSSSKRLVPELPVYPLSSIPMKPAAASSPTSKKSASTTAQGTTSSSSSKQGVIRTVPF